MVWPNVCLVASLEKLLLMYSANVTKKQLTTNLPIKLNPHFFTHYRPNQMARRANLISSFFFLNKKKNGELHQGFTLRLLCLQRSHSLKVPTTRLQHSGVCSAKQRTCCTTKPACKHTHSMDSLITHWPAFSKAAPTTAGRVLCVLQEANAKAVLLPSGCRWHLIREITLLTS